MSEAAYEGKAKRMEAAEQPGCLRMVFKDDATAFNGQKHAVLADKGRLNKAITLKLYQALEAAGVATHLVADVDAQTLLVRHLRMIPLEVVVRRVVAGSLAKRTGLARGTVLAEPVAEFYLKDDALGDPMLAPTHVRALGLASDAELAELEQAALDCFGVLEPLFAGAGLRLVDLKLEYGRTADGALVLADEVSPDTCRLWDVASGEVFDKDRFRQNLGDVIGHYRQIAERIGASCS
jgi:phosphoribosylaminoimidazole-succinocarboxamide synthase